MELIVRKRDREKRHTSIIVSLTNSMNETPLDVARKFAKTECITILGGTYSPPNDSL